MAHKKKLLLLTSSDSLDNNSPCRSSDDSPGSCASVITAGTADSQVIRADKVGDVCLSQDGSRDIMTGTKGYGEMSDQEKARAEKVEMLAHHKESLEALKASITPAERQQLAVVVNTISR
ncbi:unnamed protein product [Protopolystoma xenopodis]|uniref:Uncharacterized protein n=1 Tax=Protopolystoma xenopodis TaxID=117903 RepID=A0A448WBV6_9PLAT|nr:unnamed protein product [Protopolystoma xenopodis]